jgi:hypothetical protein
MAAIFLRASIGCTVFIAAVFLLLLPQAHATLIPIGDAANYGVLYTGTGGHNLSISNVTINGNVGVGGTGAVQFSGPGTINGRVDFSAANTGQFHNTNGSNVGPSSVNYGQSNITTNLGNLALLSSQFSGLGSSLALSGTQTVNQSGGLLSTLGGTTYRIFNVTSYSAGDGDLLTINGDGSGNPLVFVFDFNSNVNLGGDIALNGLIADQLLFDFTTSGKNISLNNNASSFPLPLAFQGIILAPNDVMSMVNANLNGRFFGGNSSDMHIVSGDTLNAPPPPHQVPEPSSLVLFSIGFTLLGWLGLYRSRVRSL